MKKRFANPNRRVGICAGCKSLDDQPLYRIGSLERWRCRECYKRETGGYP